jgi:hypothetical protein
MFMTIYIHYFNSTVGNVVLQMLECIMIVVVMLLRFLVVRWIVLNISQLQENVMMIAMHSSKCKYLFAQETVSVLIDILH